MDLIIYNGLIIERDSDCPECLDIRNSPDYGSRERIDTPESFP